MKEYNLKITNTAPTDWSEVERANIDSYVWGGAERAYATYGQLSYAKTGDEKSGLYIHLFCEEKNPVSIETQLDGKVYEDSCMEFFFTMRDISAGDIGYINIECNSLGISRISFGEGRHGRVFLGELGIERFPISVNIGNEGWEILVFVPESSLKKIFGLSDISEDTVMRGNFYKCDENAGAPFGSWSPIASPSPDFHRPESFGRIVITK
ncbi:MAG: carbohydrate-binding family 9-like protein [Clostridia bacterium]|nr:carbohydrate-binding family 9-like protein [Clostridia bacterium]